MYYLRIIIATLFAFTALVLGLMFFTFDEKYEMSLVTEAFLKDDYEKVEQLLQKFPKTDFPAQNALYNGYLLRKKRDFFLSNQQFALARSLLDLKKNKETILETYINQILNAFLSNDPTDIDELLDEVKSILHHDPFLTWLGGLVSYMKYRYMLAIEFWEIDEKVPFFSSPLLKKAMQEYFSPLRNKLALAHCYIETGNYLKARERLQEFENSQASGEESYRIALFMGMSYLAEGNEKSFDLSFPYYSQAHSYFKQVPLFHPSLERERAILIEKYSEITLRSLKEEDFIQTDAFIQMLKQWNAKQAIANLYNHFVEMWKEQIEKLQQKQANKIAHLIVRFFYEKNLKKQLQKELQYLLKKRIDQGQFDLLHLTWGFIPLFDSSKKKLEREGLSYLIKKIQTLLYYDDHELTHITPYLNFWDEHEKNSQYRYRLAENLMLTANAIWLDPIHASKAFELLKIAERIPAVKADLGLKKDLIHTLNKAYTSQENLAGMGKTAFPYLEEAFTYFHHHPHLRLFSQEEIKQEYVRGKQLFQNGHYWEAEKIAAWAVGLLQEKEPVFILAGKSAYEQQEYERTLFWFGRLSDPILPEVQELIGLSQIKTGEEKKGITLLKQLCDYYPLQDQTLLLLSYVFMEKNDLQQSLFWLEQIKHKTDEVLSLFFYIAYLEKEWEKALNHYQELTYPYHFVLKTLAQEAMRLFQKEKQRESNISFPIDQTKIFEEDLTPEFRQFFLPIISPALDLT